MRKGGYSDRRERKREREREREREFFIYEGYIQPSPKQGTTLDLIVHEHIF